MKKHLRTLRSYALLAGSALLLTLAPAYSYADEVWGFTLVNAGNNTDLWTLNDGETINLSAVGRQLNIRANTNGEMVDKVVFELDGNPDFRTEGVAPYMLAGDNGGDYMDWAPSVGVHTLKATPYNPWGEAGASLTITFNVIEETNWGSPCDAAYEEQNGVVVAEIENLSLPDGWQVKTDAGGYTGNGYIEWVYGDQLSSPGVGFIETTVKINRTGKYRFYWYNKVGKGNSPTDHNDTWLKFPDASDFYAEGSRRVYPHGSGKWPTPEGAGGDGWFKVYSSGSTDWTRSTNTSDNELLQIIVEFNTPGVYKLQMSVRSDGHLLDRLAMFHESVDTNTALQLSNSETRCSGASAANNAATPATARLANSATASGAVENRPVITVYPNPTASDITIGGLKVQSAADLDVSLTNGTVTYRPAYRVVGSDKVQVMLSNSNIQAGYYILRLKHNGRDYFQKVIIK